MRIALQLAAVQAVYVRIDIGEQTIRVIVVFLILHYVPPALGLNRPVRCPDIFFGDTADIFLCNHAVVVQQPPVELLQSV